ncbi:MAG TPA: hypothetical protein VMV71_03730 [Candidatus Paceibacterota bacterium]|nr:hypothetical protein [Candidatus Paceibacterota bacterium]
MNIYRKTSIILGAALFTALVVSAPAKAANAANCDFSEGLKALSAAQSASALSDNKETIMNELAIRKNLINQAIDCSVSETLDLQSRVKAADASYAGLNDIQNRIISKLNDVLNYYQAQKDMVGNLGIEGSKTFSAGLESWRESNYVPLAELGSNFIIFSKNQYILQTAANRLNQITVTIKTLQLDDDQKISNDLDQAAKSISLANDDNNQIMNAFRTMAWPNNISALTDSSLSHMKDAYQNFFDISTEAQSIISSR